MNPTTAHELEWMSAILHAAEQAGIAWDTAQIRGAALQQFEERIEVHCYPLQDDRVIPEEGAIVYCPEMGRTPWGHAAVFGDKNGNTVVEMMWTPTEQRPDTVICAGLTFVRWLNSREMGPMNEPFQEF